MALVKAPRHRQPATDEQGPRLRGHRWPAVAQALAAWVALIAVAAKVGEPMRRRVKIGTPPLVGGVARIDLAQASVLLTAVAVVAGGGLLAWWLPIWCRRVRWRWLLVGLAVVAVGWGVAIALLRGPTRLTYGLSSRYEYPAVVDDVERAGVGRFVESFSDHDVLSQYPVHVQGHPVGTPLLFFALERVGLGGGDGATKFVLAAALLTVPAVAMTVREVAGEGAARQAAPFLALAPGVIWAVTSADSLFSTVGALAVMSVVLATSPSRSPGRRALLALAGGIGFGIGIHLSYGLAPLMAIPVAIAVWRRRWSVLAAAAIGGLAVIGAFSAAGFFWLHGLNATHGRYLAGIASDRPYPYFALLANPAAFALIVGPAAFVALRLVRDRRVWLLGGAGLAAVAISNLSGLSKGEVERIWLPFAPWVLVLTAGLATGEGRSPDGRAGVPLGLVRLLLALQVTTAIVVESTVLTLW